MSKGEMVDDNNWQDGIRAMAQMVAVFYHELRLQRLPVLHCVVLTSVCLRGLLAGSFANTQQITARDLSNMVFMGRDGQHIGVSLTWARQKVV